MTRIKRLAKEGVWIVLGQGAAVGASLVGVRLFTELLDPVAYGELALGMTLVTLVNQVVFGPLSSGVTRFYAPAVEQGDLGGYLSAIRRLVLTATGIIIILAGAGLLIALVAGLAGWIALATAGVIFSILSGYNSILSGIQNAARQRSIVAIHQGMEPWARYLVATALMVWLGGTSKAAMVGYAMAAILVFGSQCVFIRTIIPSHVTCLDKGRSWLDKIWRYSWPMAVAGVTSWGFLASQIWALKLFATKADVGFYSVIFQIGFTPLMIAGGILMSLMMPIIFSRAGDGLDKQKVDLVAGSIIKFCLVAFLIVLLSTSIGAAFHNIIFRLLVAEQYRVYSHYLPSVILAGGLLQVSIFLSTIVLASSKTRILLPMNTIGNFLIAAINLIFTFLFGMIGLFVAMVIGSAIHLTWNIHNAWRACRNV